jgi:hypothetical protein
MHALLRERPGAFDLRPAGIRRRFGSRPRSSDFAFEYEDN